MSFTNPLNWTYLLSAPKDTEVFGLYSSIYFGLAVVAALVSGYIFFEGKFRFQSNLLRYTLVNRASRAVLIVSGLALVASLARIIGVSGFDIRLWLWLVVVLALIQAIRGVVYIVRTLPKAREEWAAYESREASRRRVAQTAPLPTQTAPKVAPTLTPSTVGAGVVADSTTLRDNVVDTLESGRGIPSRRAEKRRARRK